MSLLQKVFLFLMLSISVPTYAGCFDFLNTISSKEISDQSLINKYLDFVPMSERFNPPIVIKNKKSNIDELELELLLTKLIRFPVIKNNFVSIDRTEELLKLIQITDPEDFNKLFDKLIVLAMENKNIRVVTKILNHTKKSVDNKVFYNYIIKHPELLQIKLKDDSNIIYEALKNKRNYIVKQLIEVSKKIGPEDKSYFSILNEYAKYDKSILILAVEQRNVDIVKFLFENSQVNSFVINEKSGKTAHSVIAKKIFYLKRKGLIGDVRFNYSFSEKALNYIFPARESKYHRVYKDYLNILALLNSNGVKSEYEKFHNVIYFPSKEFKFNELLKGEYALADDKLENFWDTVLYALDDVENLKLLIDRNPNFITMGDEDRFGRHILVELAFIKHKQNLINTSKDQKNIENNKLSEVIRFLLLKGAELPNRENAPYLSGREIAEIYLFILSNKDLMRIKDHNGNTVLTNAVQANDVTLIKRFMKEGVNLNVQNNEGDTPLMAAVRFGSYDAAKMLLNMDKNGNKIDPNLKNSADAGIPNKYGVTPRILLRRIKSRSSDFSEEELKVFNELEKLLSPNSDLLFYASEFKIKMALDGKINDWELLEDVVHTLLYNSVSKTNDDKDLEVAKLYLKKFKKFMLDHKNLIDHNENYSALTEIAAHYNSVDAFKFLIELGADFPRSKGTLELILDNIELKNIYSKRHRTNVLSISLEILNKEKYKEKDYEKSLDDIKKRILKNNKHVNFRDDKGMTPLIYAIENKLEGIINPLLDNGANPHLLTINGETALEIARKNNIKNKQLYKEYFKGKSIDADEYKKTLLGEISTSELNIKTLQKIILDEEYQDLNLFLKNNKEYLANSEGVVNFAINNKKDLIAKILLDNGGRVRASFKILDYFKKHNHYYDVYYSYNLKMSPVFFAIDNKKRSVENIHYFMNKINDYNLIDLRTKQSLLMKIVSWDKHQLLKEELIEKILNNSTELSYNDVNGNSILDHLIIKSNGVLVSRFLDEVLKNIDPVDDQYMLSQGLITAVKMNNFDALLRIHNIGGSFSYINPDNKLAFDFAIERRVHIEIIDFILENTENSKKIVEDKRFNGQNSLTYVLRYSPDVELLKLLDRYGINVNLKYRKSLTPVEFIRTKLQRLTGQIKESRSPNNILSYEKQKKSYGMMLNYLLSRNRSK